VFPQTIAHRGYKAEHPENTMRAFQGAVEVGAHALETDIHLSKDGIVVLSHVILLASHLYVFLTYQGLGCGPKTLLWSQGKDHRV
jgi:hypothetical protein